MPKQILKNKAIKNFFDKKVFLVSLGSLIVWSLQLKISMKNRIPRMHRKKPKPLNIILKEKKKWYD